MSDHRRTRFWLLVVGPIALVVYALSYGPVSYVLCLLPQQGNFHEVTSSIFRVVYKPHILVVLDNRAYFEYSRWWMTLALRDEFVMTWDQWQDIQSKTVIDPDDRND